MDNRGHLFFLFCFVFFMNKALHGLWFSGCLNEFCLTKPAALPKWSVDFVF